MKRSTILLLLSLTIRLRSILAQNFTAEPPCAIPCLTSALSLNNCSPTNTTCQCSPPISAAILTAMGPCVLVSCTSPGDFDSATRAGLMSCVPLSTSSTATVGSGSGTLSTASSGTTSTGQAQGNRGLKAGEKAGLATGIALGLLLLFSLLAFTFWYRQKSVRRKANIIAREEGEEGNMNGKENGNKVGLSGKEQKNTERKVRLSELDGDLGRVEEMSGVVGKRQELDTGWRGSREVFELI